MLSPFPAEVLLVIAEHLDAPGLAALLRVNSFFHAAFLEALYESVEAVRRAGPAAYPPLGEQGFRRLVRCLNVRPHAPAACAAAPDYGTLQLKVVRVYLASDRFNDLLHEAAPAEEDIVELAPCRFLEHVRADTLVIAETALWPVPSRAMLRSLATEGTRRVVLFLPPEGSVLSGARDRLGIQSGEPRAIHDVLSYLRRLVTEMPTVRSTTLVLQHPSPTAHRGPAPTPLSEFARALLDPSRALVRGVVDVSVTFWWDRLVPEAPSRVLTVVLPEGVLSPACRQYLEQSIPELQQTRRTAIQLKYGVLMGYPAVRILGMLEFMTCPEYSGVMTRDQERIWSARSDLPHYEMTVDEVAECIN